MTDLQVSYPVQAIVLYQSLLLMKCPAVIQQNVHFTVQEQQFLLQLTEQLRALEPENSCLLLLSELHKERQESSNKKRKRQILELHCLRQIELGLRESNRSFQELTLDIRKEENLHREAERKFRELEKKNDLEIENMQERIEDFIDHMLELELLDTEELHVLHVAAEYGGPHLTAKLTDVGLSVSSLDDNGRIPLFSAARGGQAETVKLLLQQGSDVNARDAEGLLVLHAAVFSGSFETVQILIDNGSEINVRATEFGITPLSIAANSGYLSLVKLLVHSGANVNIEDSEEDNVLMSSIGHDHADVACWLLKNVPNIDIKSNKLHLTALTLAIYRGNDEIIHCLLQNGFPVDAENYEDISPLAVAAVQGNLATTNLLLKFGASVNHADEDGFTPLHFAAFKGHLQVARSLVAHNADISAVSIHGRTPESIAKRNKHHHVAKFLENVRKGFEN